MIQNLIPIIAELFFFFLMSLGIMSCDKQRIKQVFESTHILFKWRHFARAEKWEVRGERKRREERLVTQKLSSSWLWAALPIPTMIERAVFMVVLKLSTLTSMWFQLWITRLKGGEKLWFILFCSNYAWCVSTEDFEKYFIMPLIQKWSKGKTKRSFNPFIFASRFKQPLYQWT